MKVLFDRRDPASVLWPKRATFETLLEILNTADLANVWGEDETAELRKPPAAKNKPAAKKGPLDDKG